MIKVMRSFTNCHNSVHLWLFPRYEKKEISRTYACFNAQKSSFECLLLLQAVFVLPEDDITVISKFCALQLSVSSAVISFACGRSVMQSFLNLKTCLWHVFFFAPTSLINFLITNPMPKFSAGSEFPHFSYFSPSHFVHWCCFVHSLSW